MSETTRLRIMQTTRTLEDAMRKSKELRADDTTIGYASACGALERAISFVLIDLPRMLEDHHNTTTGE